MKRLFTCAGEHFKNKVRAKMHRERLVAENPNRSLPTVSIGPDHWRFGLEKRPGTTHTNSGRVGDGFRVDKRHRRAKRGTK